MKKRYKLGTAILFLAPFFSQADIWDELKKIPATQYDVGRVYTDIAANEFNKKYAGEDVSKTKYRVQKVTSLSVEDELGIKFILEARGKYINPSDCSALASDLKASFAETDIVKSIWPSLSSQQHKSILESYVIQAELVNRDNNASITTCNA